MVSDKSIKIGDIRSPGIRSPGIEIQADASGKAPTLGVPDGEAAEFSQHLQRDPGAALAGAGITVSPAEARRVGDELKQLLGTKGSRPDLAKIKIQGEITGTIKIPIGR